MSEPSGAARPAQLRLVLACDLGEVRALGHTVRSFLAKHGCAETELQDCELALVEACNNAIKYTLPGARQNPILVDALCDSESIELRIADRTAGFEWPEHMTLPASEDESGRGLFLIRSLMDDADYFRGADGNVLVMRKKRGLNPNPPLFIV
jgi:serine/threonine-protein kinase RsbW